MQTETMFVTPEMAKRWLDGNKNNRNIRKHKIAKFRSDLRNGEFKLTHQGIAFNCNGDLKDGQHRLTAIAQEGIGAWLQVSTGLQTEAVMYIDRGSPRSIHDNAKMTGFEVSQTAIAIAHVAMGAPQCVKHSSSTSEREIVDFIRNRQEAFAFVERGRKKLLTKASIMAAFVRAHSYCDIAKLERCISLFLNGLDEHFDPATELAINSFRDFCLRSKPKSYSDQLEMYQRAQRAIKAFMEGERLQLIKPCSDDLYPVTETLLLK